MRIRVVVLGVALIAAGAVFAGQRTPMDKPQIEPRSVPQGASQEPVTGMLFVDASAGVDSATCGIEPPCRTIQGAVDRIPMAFEHDVMVRVAPGTYPGGILIAGRTSPYDSRVILRGVPLLTIITASEERENGITVIRSSNIVIENLTIEGFPGMGIRVLQSTGSQIRSVILSGNGDGLFLGESETLVVVGIVEDSLRHGVSCEGGWATFGEGGADEILLEDNAASGVHAGGCHVSVLGPMSIYGSRDGFLAVHGGEIDLNMRGDIVVGAGPGESALTADCHGMIAGYSTQYDCLAVRYGVCEPGLAPGGGRTRRPILDRNG